MEDLFKPEGFPGLPHDWTRTSHTFRSQVDGKSIFYQSFSSGKADGRVFLICHGLGEHGGRYQHFAHFLDDVVSDVVCIDHRGHGRSHGARGYVEHFDEYVDDLANWIRLMGSESYKGREIHLLAQSMGGLIALRALQRYSQLPLRSVTLSAPLLEVKIPVPAIKHFLGTALSNIWGSLQLPTGISGAHICRDPEVIKAYEADSLNHTKMTPRLYVELENAMDMAFNHSDFIPYKISFFIPMADDLVNSEKTIEYFGKIEAEEIAIVKLEGFYHEPFNDLGKEEVFSELKKWICQN